MSTGLVNQFKSFYRDFHRADLSTLERLYDSDVVFRDPLHQIHGIGKLEDYMVELSTDLSECYFEYLDESVSEENAYVKWIMHFRHPKLGEKSISVRGVTHIQYTDVIHFQEDIYDLGAMLYEHVPVLGSITHWLKSRLAA